MSGNVSTQVLIIGAGPYGLSLAAHLNSRKIRCRIFGKAMQMWSERMPKGMVLKSDGFASNLSAGKASFTLEEFCAEKGYDYHRTHLPVKLEHFIEYGVEFQRRFVPQLEENTVTEVRRVAGGYRVRLDDGEEILTPVVVSAVGISHFEHVPAVFHAMPERYVSHASDYSDLTQFLGRKITVLGAGASALAVAAILKDHGVDVTLIARAPEVIFSDGPKEGERTWWEKLRAPETEVGSGWRNWMVTHGPHVFRMLPEATRLRIVKRHLGPAGNWAIKRKVVGRVPMILSTEVTAARVQDGQVHLTLTGPDGASDHVTDHVIAATGYEIDIERLGFLGKGLRGEIKTAGNASSPVLSANFESSVRGLYFIGAASAPTFGPVMRFACGARYACTWLSWHLERVSRSKRRAVAMAELQTVE